MVLEPGPGMGFFTLELARLVGKSGRVIAVDIQAKMLDSLKRHAQKAGVIERIDARLAAADSMGLGEFAGSVDFTLAFAMVHEMPDAAKFFREVAAASKPGATLLLAEPKGHVKEADFAEELKRAADAGFQLIDRPRIKSCHTALLKRS